MKIAKIILIFLLVLVLAIISVPVLFKAQLLEVAKKEINESIRAEVDWKSFRLSVIRGFPDLKVSMNKLTVKGVESFKGDTLMQFDDFSVRLDLISLISGEISVKSIILNKPVFNAIALNDSIVNWDISYPPQEPENIEDESDESGDFTIDLREFRINNAQIMYYDAVSDLYSRIADLDFLLEGNLSTDYSRLRMETTLSGIDTEMDNIKYLSNAELDFKALLDVDLQNQIYRISENSLRLNEIEMGLEGFASLKPDGLIDVDVEFSARETSFKSILSMIPAIYSKDFNTIETSGTLAISAHVKGEMHDEVLPSVELSLGINNGFISYPGLPESIDNIQVDINAFYDGIARDNSRLDINSFYLELAGNPVNIEFRARTPFTDLQMNGKILADVNLNNLAGTVPIDSISLEGKMNMNVEFMGSLSDIKNENYENFMAEGVAELSDVRMEGENLPLSVSIEELRVIFSPQYLRLESFNSTLGESDVALAGNIENYIPYIFDDETLVGNFELQSSLINLNELLASEESMEHSDVEDSEDLTVFEIPSALDFTFSSEIESLRYQKLQIENFSGLLIARDKVLSMEKLNMNLLGGNLRMSGEYNTRDTTTPMVEFQMNLDEIAISPAFDAFNTVRELAPIAQMTEGKVTVELDYISFLDSAMRPVMNTIVGSGRLVTNKIKIHGNQTLDAIAKLLGSEDFLANEFNDIDLNFELRDGRAEVKPFRSRSGDITIDVSGSQGLDKSLSYELNFELPTEKLGSTRENILGQLQSKANEEGFGLGEIENIKLGVIIEGTFSDPELRLDMKNSLSGVKKKTLEVAREKTEEEIEEVKDDAIDRVKEEAQKIISEAEKEAEKIVKAAEDAGNSLTGEAQLRKKQLVEEAGNNPIKRMAAEKAGDSLIKSAREKAEKLKEESQQQAQQIIETARKKADELD